MRNKRFRRRPAGGKETEKIRRGDLKRDAAFCGVLARELDVEEAPASYHKALRDIYAELPRDMPVRHDPVRSALKSAAAAVAVLAVFALTLLGANRAYPQLTESLPGVGMIFKTLNGTEDVPNLPPAPNTIQVVRPTGKKEAHKIPDFTPVQVEDADGQGEIWVENAWCDGEQVYLDVSLWVDADVLHEAGFTEGNQADTCLFWEGGSSGLEDSLLLSLRYDGISRGAGEDAADQYHYRDVWKLEVPASSQMGESVRLQMNLDRAWFSLEGKEPPILELPSGLTLDLPLSLTVEVDQDFAVTVEESDPDNGYTVTSLRYTPGELTASVAVPYMGTYGYSLLPVLPDSESAGGAPLSTPYGTYAVLSGEDGTVLWESLLDSGEYDPNTMLYPEVGLSALLRPANREKLVLTFYQFDPETLERWAADALLSPEEIVNPVTAEFTLDLAEGTLAPSENYAEDGGIRLDAARPLTGDNHPGFDANGLYVKAVDTARMEDDGTPGVLVEIVIHNYTYTALPASWALQGLKDGEVVQTVYGCDLQELRDQTVSRPDLEGVPVYESEGGRFWQKDGEYEPNTYLHVFFEADYPEWMQGPFDQLRLVNTETGEVTLEDVAASYQRNLRGVLTAEAYQN